MVSFAEMLSNAKTSLITEFCSNASLLKALWRTLIKMGPPHCDCDYNIDQTTYTSQSVSQSVSPINK